MSLKLPDREGGKAYRASHEMRPQFARWDNYRTLSPQQPCRDKLIRESKYGEREEKEKKSANTGQGSRQFHDAIMSHPQMEDTPTPGDRSTRSTASSEKGKMPISPYYLSQNTPPHNDRVPRACQACRHRKVKCDGAKPRCTYCHTMAIECVYPSNKRERTKELVEHLVMENRELEAALYRATHGEGESSSRPAQGTLKRPREESTSASSSTSSQGSFDGMDDVTEDLNRSSKSRATGFLGKNSSAAWMRSLMSEVDKTYGVKGSEQIPTAQPGDWTPSSPEQSRTMASQSYYDDQRELFSVGAVSPYDLPSRPIADKLLENYLESVNRSFPIIRESLFTQQYQRVFSDEPVQPRSRWLAILNLVFAIGSKYCFLSGQGGSEQFTGEVFLKRATALGADNRILYAHADLQQVQLETLVAFYFLVSSHINRAWKMIRVASGSGIALGINMHSTSSQLDLASKEARCRLWCSIFMIEHLLSCMTGRPTCLMNSFSSNPPLPVEESHYQDFWTTRLHGDQLLREKLLQWTLYQANTDLRSQLLQPISPNASLYLFYAVDLSLIAQQITGHLYGARAFVGWPQIERKINFYSRKLDIWLSAVNSQFLLSSRDSKYLPSAQISLLLHYHSVGIMLNRPCLSRPNVNLASGIRHPRSRFENDRASACTQSALSLLDILPEEADIQWIYSISPWWAMLHFLMQATIVLLIQLAVGPVPTKAETAHGNLGKDGESVADMLAAVPLACQKALRWLQSMSVTDSTSLSGFQMCNDLYCRIESAKKFQREQGAELSLLELATGGHSNLPRLPLHNPTAQQSPSTEHRPTRHSEGDEVSLFTSDPGQPYAKETIFPQSVLQDSDIAWLLSAVGSNMSYPPQ